jgi:hypothetical protein
VAGDLVSERSRPSELDERVRRHKVETASSEQPIHTLLLAPAAHLNSLVRDALQAELQTPLTHLAILAARALSL